MTFLVTGHEGLLGSNFIKKLVENKKTYWTIEGDISSEGFIVDFEKMYKDDDFVIVHFAGNKNNDSDLSLRNNIIVTSQICRLAQNTRCKGIVYISSIAALGITNGVVTSDTMCNPVSNYGKSKMICEQVVESFCRNYCVVRPTNIVDTDRVGVLKTIADSIRNGTRYELWKESLNSKRDYISLDDVTEALYNIALKISNNTMIVNHLNLGSGLSYSMSEVIKLFENVMKTKLSVKVTTNPTFVSYDLIVDSKDTKAILGREPETIEKVASKMRGI